MMRSTEPLLDTFLVTLRAPWSTANLSFFGLEVVVVICGVLSLLHALRARERGDGLPLFTWGVSFTYGLVMEIGSYNFLESFKHGQFAVMFYKHQLPLYVVTLYPVLQYTSIITARRLRAGWVAQTFTAGALIVAMDFPFDILGPVLGWWSWSDSDPNMAFRWHNVPVTSYYWHLAWGGLLAAVTRGFARWGADPKKPVRIALLALPLSYLTIFFGLISFLPFHFLKSRGISDGTIVAGLFALSLTVAALSRPAAEPRTRDRELLRIPVLYYAYHFFAALVLFGMGTPGFGGRMAVIAVVTAGALGAYGLANRPMETRQAAPERA
ncbi:Hypothetical protein A7982_06693 [Minicystis rosea]|nr:Hypothetical protein A7982_06693 [Minicystis rosea]